MAASSAAHRLVRSAALNPTGVAVPARSALHLSLRRYATDPSPTPSTSAFVHPPNPIKEPQPTNLPGSNLPKPEPSKYSPFTVSLVKGLARVFGYNSSTSTAIRTASDYYDSCAERGEVESAFFYSECALPPSFQTWFSITTLHLWILTTRLRALPAPHGHSYTQELLNHFFVDLELRIRGPYAVTQNRLVKGYMNDMLSQYRGAVTAYDEALIAASTTDSGVGSDAVLAAALWRNLWGAGWGAGGGGVKGKKAPKPGEKPTLGPDPTIDHVQATLLRKGKVKPEQVFVSDEPVVDPALADKASGAPTAKVDTLEYPEMEFPVNLERLVRWVRHEINRLEKVEDEKIMRPGVDAKHGPIVQFSRI